MNREDIKPFVPSKEQPNVTDRPPPPPISAAEQAAKDARRALIARVAARFAQFKADEAALLREGLEADAHGSPSAQSNIRGRLSELGLP